MYILNLILLADHNIELYTDVLTYRWNSPNINNDAVSSNTHIYYF